MLNVYIGNITGKPSGIPYVQNVDAEFSKLSLSSDKDEYFFLKEIDKIQRVVDSVSFIDRFGFKLPSSELSTGCKAAICVLRCTNKVIDLCECGFCATGMILSRCTDGNVYIPEYNLSYPDYGNDVVSIKFGSYVFTSFSRFFEYLDNEWPYNPDMSKEGIRSV